jgi:uncharacterized protein
MSERVILDTSTLVSAALRAGSMPHQALLNALACCDLCASEETLVELERVLQRKKFDLYLNRELRNEFLALIRHSVHLFAVRSHDLEAVDPPCRDPKDSQFLALAMVSEASLLVSSDEDLLVLHPWHGISILTPSAFLSRSSNPPD